MPEERQNFITREQARAEYEAGNVSPKGYEALMELAIMPEDRQKSLYDTLEKSGKEEEPLRAGQVRFWHVYGRMPSVEEEARLADQLESASGVFETFGTKGLDALIGSIGPKLVKDKLVDEMTGELRNNLLHENRDMSDEDLEKRLGMMKDVIDRQATLLMRLRDEKNPAASALGYAAGLGTELVATSFLTGGIMSGLKYGGRAFAPAFEAATKASPTLLKARNRFVSALAAAKTEENFAFLRNTIAGAHRAMIGKAAESMPYFAKALVSGADPAFRGALGGAGVYVSESVKNMASRLKEGRPVFQELDPKEAALITGSVVAGGTVLGRALLSAGRVAGRVLGAYQPGTIQRLSGKDPTLREWLELMRDSKLTAKEMETFARTLDPFVRPKNTAAQIEDFLARKSQGAAVLSTYEGADLAISATKDYRRLVSSRLNEMKGDYLKRIPDEIQGNDLFNRMLAVRDSFITKDSTTEAIGFADKAFDDIFGEIDRRMQLRGAPSLNAEYIDSLIHALNKKAIRRKTFQGSASKYDLTVKEQDAIYGRFKNELESILEGWEDKAAKASGGDWIASKTVRGAQKGLLDEKRFGFAGDGESLLKLAEVAKVGTMAENPNFAKDLENVASAIKLLKDNGYTLGGGVIDTRGVANFLLDMLSLMDASSAVPMFQKTSKMGRLVRAGSALAVDRRKGYAAAAMSGPLGDALGGIVTGIRLIQTPFWARLGIRREILSQMDPVTFGMMVNGLLWSDEGREYIKEHGGFTDEEKKLFDKQLKQIEGKADVKPLSKREADIQAFKQFVKSNRKSLRRMGLSDEDLDYSAKNRERVKKLREELIKHGKRR